MEQVILDHVRYDLRPYVVDDESEGIFRPIGVKYTDTPSNDLISLFGKYPNFIFVADPLYKVNLQSNYNSYYEKIYTIGYKESYNYWIEINNLIEGYYKRDENEYVEIAKTKNGSREGKSIILFDDIIRALRCYRDNELNGNAIIYHDNGKILSEHIYKNGKKNGLAVEMDRNGKITAIMFYQNNKLNGPKISFWDNGNVRSKIEHSDGERIGTYQEWDEEGNLVKTRNIDSQ